MKVNVIRSDINPSDRTLNAARDAVHGAEKGAVGTSGGGGESHMCTVGVINQPL